ncbi:hypothetical protein GQ43DRAFT_122725 [Delitschia confertaspora ATCC 74209]|uniref:Secreted protein n=1 Tax=Delitschia confertaspora ATCC 74209 TaxID=1513339 RepID=A0A9P4JMN4_9PLEO|nr:hypothetical protein GQ43DRAFT_122725 [Delitschia confertaspora ATCC 74209]
MVGCCSPTLQLCLMPLWPCVRSMVLLDSTPAETPWNFQDPKYSQDPPMQYTLTLIDSRSSTCNYKTLTQHLHSLVCLVWFSKTAKARY